MAKRARSKKAKADNTYDEEDDESFVEPPPSPKPARKKKPKKKSYKMHELDTETATDIARRALCDIDAPNTWSTDATAAAAAWAGRDLAQAATVTRCALSRRWGWFCEEEPEENPYSTVARNGQGPWDECFAKHYVDAPANGCMMRSPNERGERPIAEVLVYECEARFRDAEICLRFRGDTLCQPETEDVDDEPCEHYMGICVQYRRVDARDWTVLCSWERIITTCGGQDDEHMRGKISASAVAELARLLEYAGNAANRKSQLLHLVWRLLGTPARDIQIEQAYNLRNVNADGEDAQHDWAPSISGALRLHLLDIAACAPEGNDEYDYDGGEHPAHALTGHSQSLQAWYVHAHDATEADLGGAVMRSCCNRFGITDNAACVHNLAGDDERVTRAFFGGHTMILYGEVTWTPFDAPGKDASTNTCCECGETTVTGEVDSDGEDEPQDDVLVCEHCGSDTHLGCSPLRSVPVGAFDCHVCACFANGL